MDKIKPLATSRSRVDDARGARNFVRAEIGKLEGLKFRVDSSFKECPWPKGRRTSGSASALATKLKMG